MDWKNHTLFISHVLIYYDHYGFHRINPTLFRDMDLEYIIQGITHLQIFLYTTFVVLEILARSEVI